MIYVIYTTGKFHIYTTGTFHISSFFLSVTQNGLKGSRKMDFYKTYYSKRETAYAIKKFKFSIFTFAQKSKRINILGENFLMRLTGSEIRIIFVEFSL